MFKREVTIPEQTARCAYPKLYPQDHDQQG